jgi:uncharacterized membrane protein
MYKVFFIFVLFIVLDLIYLNFFRNFYENEMNIQYSNIKVIPAILAWACIVIAYYYTVQHPFENKYLRGIILAIGMYGVYNMTNLSIFNKYSYQLALQDTLWGVSIIALVTYINSIIIIEYPEKYNSHQFYT